MSEPEHVDTLILGSGQGGKLLAWDLARTGQTVEVVERRWVGGSCPAAACMPSKSEIWSARSAHLVRNAGQYGVTTAPVEISLARVRQRKQRMVEAETNYHLDAYKSSVAELIMGTGRFVGPRKIDVLLNDGGKRTLAGERIVVNLGSHAAVELAIRENASTGRRMIDHPERVARLLDRLQPALPRPARVTPELVATLAKDHEGVTVACMIVAINYAGDEGGIMCQLACPTERETAIHASITHLRFRRVHPGRSLCLLTF